MLIHDIIAFAIFFIYFAQCYDFISEDDDIRRMNSELLELNKMSAKLEWESSVNHSSNSSNFKEHFYKMRAKWRQNWCKKLKNYHSRKSMEIKAIYFLCRGPRYTPEEAKLLSLITGDLLMTYQSTKVCDDDGQCFHGEPDLKRLMTTSRNESVLRWAWTAWRNEMSSVKPLFEQSIELQNSGARRNGYEDMADVWKKELRIKNVEELTNTLWRSVEELYRLLHAVVRFRLQKLYPEFVDPIGPIPAHLLGDLWSQNWSTVYELLLPKNSARLDATKSLRKKNYTVVDIAKRAEDFYLSVGFPRLPKKFWQNSVFTQSNKTNRNCHGTAANMYEINDFRILGCFDVSTDDFHVIHHEMGHIYYYMAYQNQDAIFRNGVNSAFHETIGEAIFLGVMTPQHLQRLGLVDDSILTQDFAILLQEALRKLPEISYALVMEKWRWRVFEESAGPLEFNELWWELHRDIMGISPPTSRPEFYFDPAAKFHIIANVPYLRYFLANFLQFQIFDSMCQLAVTGRINNIHFKLPLHKCDIYGSRDSTKRLRNVMRMGSTMGVAEALRKLTGTSEFRVEPLLRYFAPVREFLLREIEYFSIPVGWN